MASIARRADGRWRARYRDAAGKERARHFERKVDAQAWLDSFTTAVGTGTYVDPGRAKATVGELAPVWLTGRFISKPRPAPGTPTSSGLTSCRGGVTSPLCVSPRATSRLGWLSSPAAA